MKSSTVRRLALVGLAGLALAQGTAGAATTSPLRLTKPVDASKTNLDPGRLLSSPAFAIDPSNPLRIAGGFADMRTRRCGLIRSFDGGASWSIAENSPAPAAFPFCSQGQGGVIQAPVEFGRKGTLYMGLNGWGDEDGTRNAGSIMVARSDDMGNTWQTVVAYNTRGKQGDAQENPRPIHSLAVDRKSGSEDTVYVTFSISRPSPVAPNAQTSLPAVIVSRDGGKTFGTPIDLSAGVFDQQSVRDAAFSAVTTTTVAPGATTTTVAAPAAGTKGATPNQATNFGSAGGRNGIEVAVDGKGAAYVLWRSGTVNITPAPPAAIYISKSLDQGKSWFPTQSLPFSYDNVGAQFDVSEDGTMHMVFTKNPRPELASNSKLFYRNSTDGGKTWSDAKSITDDDPSKLFAQVFPNISIAPNGRIDVAWWDTRDDPGIRSNDVYYTYSTDNGKTWAKNVRVTDQSVDRRFGIWGFNYDIASVPGVASADQFTVFGWDDTRFSRGPDGKVQVQSPIDSQGFGDGVQDLFTSSVQFQKVTSGSSTTAKAVLAGVVGLIAVAFILLGVAMVTKKRTPAPEAPKGKMKAKAGTKA